MDEIRQFVEDEIIPLEPLLLSGDFASLYPLLDEKRTKVKDAGWWVPSLTAAEGGMGMSLPEFAELSEILGRSPLGHFAFNCQAPDIGNIELLRLHGSSEQKETYLKPLIDGNIRSCFAMTEPDRPGSNPTWMDTTATEDGDHYILNGRKWFTSAADGASFCIVMAVTDPECRVPKSALFGKSGSGFKLAQERLGPGRIHHCMRWIGICERAFDLVCQRVSDRMISPKKRLGEEGVIQEWIAESRADIDAARLLVLKCANAIETEGPYSARTDVSIIKFFVAEVLKKVLDMAIQVHGALGMTDDTPLAFWYRHERGARIYDGPDEVHKRTVARQILKNYGT